MHIVELTHPFESFKERLEGRFFFALVDVFYLEKGFENVRVFYAFAKKKVLVLRMQKEKKTSMGNYIALSLILSYNDWSYTGVLKREISTYVSMHGLQS